MYPNIIKWTGTKRPLAEEIVSYFPKQINTYYEPFIGSGAVCRAVLATHRIQVEHIIVSDICQPLIILWQEIQKRPKRLFKAYKNYWNQLQEKGQDIFYTVRDEFNKDKENAGAFLFLLRTCLNGMPRFNMSGDFNTSYHLNRPGIHPDKLKSILIDWNRAIRHVEFICRDYKDSLVSITEKDFFFFDPPYQSSHSIYYGQFNYKEFFKRVSKLPCSYAITFNGTRDGEEGENNYEVDKSLYNKRIALAGKISSFSRLQQNKVNVQEILYIRYR